MESVKSCRKRSQAASRNKGVAEGNEKAQVSKKWRMDEKKKLFHCLKLYGHKDLEKMSQELPGRSKEDIRKFLIVVHSTARQRQMPKSDLNYWLNKSISETQKSNSGKMNDFYQSAQIMKFLSVDGLLESHPSIKTSEGIDFSAAYRLVYQALMGYPLQPVNQATADFVSESLTELSECKNSSLSGDLTDFLKNKYKEGGENGLGNGGKSERITGSERKPAVYVNKKSRNKVSAAHELNVPPLKIVVAEEGTNTLKNLKCYSVAIGDKKQVSTLVIPVVDKKQQNALEEAASHLWENVEFNPLGLSHKWCRLPFDCVRTDKI